MNSSSLTVKWIVGLTGGIASGKTTVSTLFAQLGVPIIDADVIAHSLVQPGQPTLALLVEAFGTEILNSDSSLNRAYLRQQVFNNVQLRKRLEAILHPRILHTMLQQSEQLSFPYCLFSIPLLVETQLMYWVRRVLVVDCSVELQRQRLAARSGLDDAEITRILATQCSREERLAVADDVILNEDNNLLNITQQIQQLHQKYLKWAQPTF